MPATLLIVDDEKHTREGLRAALEEEYEVYTAASADEAFNLLDSETFDVVLTDLRMAGKSGLKVIDKALTVPRPPVTVMMTAYGTVDNAVEAMKRGATDFLTKPVNLEKLEILLRRALEARRLQKENVELKGRLEQKQSISGIIGQSRALGEAMEKLQRVAPSRATVLLFGETGTGKEMFAAALHQNSDRRHGPFQAVHCAALAPTLLESEIFGHEKGAYTGATERREGRFEAADGGTLFLDEIGEIDASTQVKLLRFLESRSFERLGSNKPIKVDVRLVCATNRNLEDMVRKGTFREDLYYRINVVTIVLPPLRERPEDIPVLLEHFLRQFAEENGSPVLRLEPAAISALQRYPWPGNIRELRNFAENLVVLRRGGTVGVYDLDPRFLHGPAPLSVQSGARLPLALPPGPVIALPGGPAESPLSVEENEKRLYRNALIEARGNRSQAAKLLGISRRTLHRKLLAWPEIDAEHQEIAE